jgi:lipid A 3-O-deacylase
MICLKKALLILLGLSILECYGQNDSIPQKLENYFRYSYDNDFFSATDRYYTQGVRLELILNSLKHNPLSFLLIKINKRIKNYNGLAFERDGFTPRSIRVDSIYKGERPFAGVSFLSSFLISLDKEKVQKLFSQIDLGVIGPTSRGEEEQKYIHRKLKNIQPLGWEYQIANDVVINYTFQYEKGLLIKKHVEFIGSTEARAGTLYDDVSAGGLIRLGRMHNYFSDLGTSKYSEDKKFQFYGFIRGEIKVVGYNATMQGGMFSNSINTINNRNIERIVAGGSVGVVLAYKRVSLEYTKWYISPEFRHGLSHSWGHCNISVCF